jgi:hypothetical protein
MLVIIIILTIKGKKDSPHSSACILFRYKISIVVVIRNTASARAIFTNESLYEITYRYNYQFKSHVWIVSFVFVCSYWIDMVAQWEVQLVLRCGQTIPWDNSYRHPILMV